MSALDKSRFVDVSAKDLDEFTCGICHDVFFEPVVTPCCRQVFCKLCVYQWLDTNSVCPNDRKPLTFDELTSPPRLVFNLLNNMKVKCDYHSNGCEIITTLGELSKHVQNCEKNPNRICKTCALKIDDREEHNCVANLLIKNSSITNENQKLIKENQELKVELKKFNNTGITNKNVESTIQLARNCIDDYVITEITHMNSRDQQMCIEISKHAINNFNDYKELTIYLYNYLRDNDPLKRQWMAIVFEDKGGYSYLKSCLEYILLRFGRLFIELFTVKGLK